MTLILSLILFPFMPAARAYIRHGLVRADIPALGVDTAWRQVSILGRIRSGVIHGLFPAEMTGLISFPSFHAAGAVLLFWDFAGYRRSDYRSCR